MPSLKIPHRIQFLPIDHDNLPLHYKHSTTYEPLNTCEEQQRPARQKHGTFFPMGPTHVTTSKTLDSDSNSSRHFHLNQNQEDIVLPTMPKACILAETHAPSGTPHQQCRIQRKICESTPDRFTITFHCRPIPPPPPCISFLRIKLNGSSTGKRFWEEDCPGW